jgi:predicted amidophosphoribosyltransferase
MSALRERVFYAVLDLFYPPHCAVCSTPFSEGERAFLCADCDGKIERIDQHHVCRCGCPLLKGSISARGALQRARESLSRYAHSGGTKSAKTLIMC